MASRRTVAVLGPIPRDHINTHRGETFDKYGCVVYTVAALSAPLRPDDRVCPVVHVRREDEEPIRDLLAAFTNVDLTGIRSASDRGDLVELIYVDQNKRVERQTGFMDPILPEDVGFVLDADAFVCVPITDYEVGQATLAYIEQHSDAIYRPLIETRRPQMRDPPPSYAARPGSGPGGHFLVRVRRRGWRGQGSSERSACHWADEEHGSLPSMWGRCVQLENESTRPGNPRVLVSSITGSRGSAKDDRDRPLMSRTR